MRALVALVLLLLSSPLYAQTTGSTSGSTAIISNAVPSSTSSTVLSAPGVIAPGLAAAGVETCLGSAAGGLSVLGGGFTFGSTTVDEGCTIRLLARQLFAFGFQRAAVALMCEDEHVVAAMYAAGSPCPSSVARVGAHYQEPAASGRPPDVSGLLSIVAERQPVVSERPVRENGID